MNKKTTRIDFPELPIQENIDAFQETQFFSDNDPFVSKESTYEDESDLSNDDILSDSIDALLYPKKRIWVKLFFIGLLLILISAWAQTILSLSTMTQNNQWQNLLYSVAFLFILLALTGGILKEAFNFMRFKSSLNIHAKVNDLWDNHQQGNEAKLLCELLIKKAKMSEHPSVIEWRQLIESHHTNHEVFVLYAAKVQTIIDQKAQKLVFLYASEAAIMVAISPFAVIDMCFIAWRNIRLINYIAKLYGINLSWFSRIKLIKLVLFNIAFSGITELVQDVGVDWLSQGITVKVSAKLAQGAGIGLLTARLGIKAMTFCRPLPWEQYNKPNVKAFKYELFSKLKEIMIKTVK